MILLCCCMACCCPAACSTFLTKCCGLGCNVGSLIARRLTPRHRPPPQHQLRRLNPIPDQEQPNRECINGVDHCQCRVTRKRCLRLVDLQRYQLSKSLSHPHLFFQRSPLLIIIKIILYQISNSNQIFCSKDYFILKYFIAQIDTTLNSIL